VSGLFGRDGFFLVAGPCALEGDELNLIVADRIAATADRLGIRAVFKGSFDKANRTSASSHRGPGLAAGLRALRRVRECTGLPVLTDIHVHGQAADVAETVDAIQIPAFLCRQTDLLVAAAETGLPVNVKKGQWMAPEDMAGPVDKLERAGCGEVVVTERGTAFGYGRWITDMRSFRIMREVTGCATVFDATHSVQLPAAGDGASGGEPRFVETLALSAVAAGADGLFVEAHPDPAGAPSDGNNMLPLDRLPGLVEACIRVREARQ